MRVGQRLLTVSYVHVARHWVDGRNVRLSEEVLRVIVVVPGLVGRVTGSPVRHLYIVVLLEVVDACVEPFQLSGVLLVHLVLILVVGHALIVVDAAGEFACEAHVGRRMLPGAWRGALVEALQLADAAEAARVGEGLLLVLRLAVHALLVAPRVVQVQLVRRLVVPLGSGVMHLSSTLLVLHRVGQAAHVPRLRRLRRWTRHVGQAVPATGVALIESICGVEPTVTGPRVVRSTRRALII